MEYLGKKREKKIKIKINGIQRKKTKNIEKLFHKILFRVFVSSFFFIFYFLLLFRKKRAILKAESKRK